MRLVELLARELEEWPEGADVAVQDLDENVYFNESARSIEYESEEMGAWSEVNGRSGWIDEWITASFLATDHATAIVTRSMWEAERAKMEEKAEGKAEWNGEGLPPVGVECEIRYLGKYNNNWMPFRATAITNDFVVGYIRNDRESAVNHKDPYVEFRPIRTLEQIAAQEREQAITDLMQTTCIRRGEAARIYDAGYRKQEQSE